MPPAVLDVTEPAAGLLVTGQWPVLTLALITPVLEAARFAGSSQVCTGSSQGCLLGPSMPSSHAMCCRATSELKCTTCKPPSLSLGDRARRLPAQVLVVVLLGHEGINKY